MSFSVNDFMSELNRRGGPMRTNRFKVVFPAPFAMIGTDSGQVGRTMEYWCDSINFPAYGLATHDVKRWSYGPTEKRPFAPLFSQIQCTFVNDSNNLTWDYFNRWIQNIIPHEADHGINTSQNGGVVYELAYKQQYATDVNLIVYDTTGFQTVNIVIKEAFPTMIPDIPLAWGDMNRIFRFSVIFDFVDWYIQPNVLQAD
jgi:hypothetical protein